MTGSLVKRWKKDEKDKKKRNRWAIVLDFGYVEDLATGRKRRKQKWITFRGNEKAAEAKRIELVGAVNSNEFVEPSKLTLAAWLQTWLDKAVKPPLRRPATCCTYRSIVENHLIDSPLARMPLQRIRAMDIEAYYSGLGASPATIGVHHAVLSQALRMAARDRLILTNPAADVEERPRVDTKDHAGVRAQCWSPAEARTFLDTAKMATPQTAAFFAVALDTGARKSEIRGLTWDRIDLDTGIVVIDRQLAGAEFAPTRSGRTRKVTLDPRTVALLREHKRQQAALKMRNRMTYADRGLVFAKEPADLQTPTAALGDPVNLARTVFARLTKAAGVRPIRFHGLRHTAASLLLSAGVPVMDVAARLGHSKASMTLDVYGHALPGSQETAAARLGALLHG